MGQNWNGGGADEGTIKVSRMNSFLRPGAPQPGETQELGGAGAQTTEQLSGGWLYVVTAQAGFHIAASGATLTATTSDLYWPSDRPFIHEAKAGVSDYISIIDAAGGAVTGSVAPLRPNPFV